MRVTYAEKTKTKADQKPPGQTQTLETREQRPSHIAHIAIDSASRSTPARQLPADGRGSEMWIVWPAPTPALHTRTSRGGSCFSHRTATSAPGQCAECISLWPPHKSSRPIKPPA